ncbi:MAG TPA: SDR family oxidoreductase [Acidimicrobiales bacterium]|jgi:NAD(P)-dependent dehydrogenase (short-subunit alcohol dehydrogenase family)|nr:SDR family oxidoreductase [Acidimicrobiales bacterium]
MEFLNASVAVTGASGGIGRVLCEHLVAQGLAVYGLDLTKDPNPPVGVIPLAVDITSANSVQSVVMSIYEQAAGPVDLVACAGIVEGDVAAEDMTVEQFDAVQAVNVRGVFLSCQAFGRELLARGGGSIVNVASMSGNCIVNYPQRQCSYNASKAAVTALTKSLAVEWGPRGVRVNAISPGYVDTPLLADKPDQFEQWKAGIIFERFAQPVEIARAVAFLLSGDSSYCCGSELVIDGGYSLR